MKSTVYMVLVFFGMLLSGTSYATWNSDWASRQKISLNTSEDGAATKADVDSEPVLVRLHTGNFAFADAKPDGSDLRFIAEDDKTPLKFHIESYDSVTELALIWVTVPKLAANSKSGFFWLYYNNPKAPAASDPKGSFDPSQVIVFHFAEKDGLPGDSTAYANNADASTASPNPGSLIASGLTFSGSAKVSVPASTSMKATSSGVTVSMWIKPDGAGQTATLFRQGDGTNAIALQLESGKLVAQVNNSRIASSADVTSGSWHHVALVAKDQITLYLDGQSTAQGSAAALDVAGSVVLGQGYKGELDEFELSSVARSADWVRIAALGQGVEQKLVTYAPSEQGEDSSSPSYLKILLGSVTIDGWVVIGILMVMLVVSFTVMIGKALFVTRTGRANSDFKERFRSLGADLTALAAVPGNAPLKGAGPSGPRAGSFPMSSMYRLYEVGTVELKKRLATYKEKGRALILTPQSIDAIRASLDACLIGEMQRLNAQMVLLTIAIAGGPFLGLLGTVVGVMITFAAIAAAGDVNVNAIAPGIAAALVATVAGLGVAIPSLFGYNYLASRIKELTNDLQVFVDEFVTRLAENYSE